MKETPHEPRHPGPDPRVSLYAESDTELLLPGRKLVVVGFTHRTAPLAVRSRFAVSRDDLPPLARRFKSLPGVQGCVLVATCNRLEAYLEIRSEAEAEAAFVDLLGCNDLEGRAVLARSLLVHSGLAAVRHLLRVVSGLDSMVLGDAQILGQCKESYRNSCQHGAAGPMLHKVFHAAFRCAKAVRSGTELGGGARSVAGSAVSLLSERIEGLRGKVFLLIGVNEMTDTACRRLVKARAGRTLWCNRTDARAREMAAQLGAEPVEWNDRLAAIAGVDAVVTCTGATDPVFSCAELAAAVAERPERPLTVVDIAVPPDVEAMAGFESPPALHVIDLEDVGNYQAEAEQRRCEAASSGENIVADQVAEFGEWLQNQTLGPKMERLRDEAERSLDRELARLPSSLTLEEREGLARFGRTLINRFLGAYRRVEDDE